MKLPVHQHPRVEQELEAAFLWWAEHCSPQQAIRWYNAFRDALQSLCENGRNLPLAAESELIPLEIRQLNFGLGSKPTHRALFVIRPDMVYVIAIRHLAQQSVRLEDLS